MNNENFNQGLLRFIEQSPSPFHAVATMEQSLVSGNYQWLDEADSWSLQRGTGYFVKRGGSIIAFKFGNQNCLDTGIHLAGAHTDSPCLKIKPVAEIVKHGYGQLGVEVYGGALLNPWFDRDLSIAGQVTFQASNDTLSSCLVNFKDPIAFIPSLAIHLDREANRTRSIDAQKHLPPILLQLADNERFDFNDLLVKQIAKETTRDDVAKVLSYELCLYDTQAPALVGVNQEFIAAARLDNLLSCYISTESLLDSNHDYTSLMVCNDHEEVGSTSASGAQGPFLHSVLSRIVQAESTQPDALDRVFRKSFLLSIDNAHGIHPNFADLHDPQHSPLLNKGPVIKVNANQRYASNGETVARFRAYCDAVDVETQSFVMRSDLACGSTIGPITAAETGISTVDIGAPTFGMHSIRELAGADDAAQLAKAVTAFFNRGH
jgi:aspartyl aminopeptidase